MSFYPDGQPRIPNQIPLPHVEPVASASDVTDATDHQPRHPHGPGSPGGSSTGERAAARNRTLVRTALINLPVLVLAVVVGIVLELPTPETGVWVVLAAALLTGVHTSIVVLRMAQPARRTSHPGEPSRPTTDAVVTDAVVTDATGVTDVTGATAAFQVEDVFTITGRGTVATGRVSRGELRVGQRVTVLRGGRVHAHARVTGIEAFRQLRVTASAGDLVGLLLAGVDRHDVERGDVVTG